MQQLLDKFQRDRWVEILTEVLNEAEFIGPLHMEHYDSLKEVIEYLEGKETV